MPVSSDWMYPEPRKGLRGLWDSFIGPGATPAEQGIALGPALVAAAALPAYAAVQGLSWSVLQYLVAALLAFDVMGGVVTNATASAKRWYHRSGQTARHHLSFVAIHVVQIGLVAWLFRDFDLGYGAGVYGALMASAWIVLRVPRRVQRSVALLLVCVFLILSAYVFTPTPGFEWFIPALFLKLLVSHLTVEEPYV